MREKRTHENDRQKQAGGFIIGQDAPLVPKFGAKIPDDEVYYLYGPILEPIEYVDLIQAIRYADEQQQITLHINSPGGDLSTCLAIINAIKASAAEIVTVIDGEAQSAGAFIWLAGHVKIVASPHTYLMIHQAAWSFHGKTAEHAGQVDIVNKVINPLLDEYADWLLTPSEKSDVLKGIDVHIHGLDIADRANKYKAQIEAAQAAPVKKAVKPRAKKA